MKQCESCMHKLVCGLSTSYKIAADQLSNIKINSAFKIDLKCVHHIEDMSIKDSLKALGR